MKQRNELRGQYVVCESAKMHKLKNCMQNAVTVAASTALYPFHIVVQIRRKRMEEIFLYSINEKCCLPFIIDRMTKNCFHFLPSNSVHRCEMGILYIIIACTFKIVFNSNIRHWANEGK